MGDKTIFQLSRLDNPSSWIQDERCKKYYQTILGCKTMEWRHLRCNGCKEILKHNAAKFSCLSPFCQEPECQQNRIRLIKAYLNTLKITSHNLLHIVFGFPHVQKISSSERKRYSHVFSSLKKYFKGKLHMIVARDIKKCDDGLYVHFHAAQLPVKDFREFRADLFRARKEIIKETGIKFTFRFKGYRNKENIYRYFSRRVAGIFGNIKKQQTYGYSDFMTIQEYFEGFYRSKKIQLIDLKPRAKLSVLAIVLVDICKKCPFCGSEDIVLVPNGEIDGEEPPPSTLEAINKQHDKPFDSIFIPVKAYFPMDRKEVEI